MGAFLLADVFDQAITHRTIDSGTVDTILINSFESTIKSLQLHFITLESSKNAFTIKIGELGWKVIADIRNLIDENPESLEFGLCIDVIRICNLVFIQKYGNNDFVYKFISVEKAKFRSKPDCDFILLYLCSQNLFQQDG